MTNKNKKNTKKKKNIIGISLGILLLIITISFITLIKILDIIPNNYFIIGLSLIIIITLFLLLFLLVKPKNIILKIIKYICYFITIILITTYTFGIYYLNKTMNFIDNISVTQEEITNYYIIVLDTSKYQESSDLYGETLAYFENTNQEVLDSLKLELTYKTAKDINNLREMLYNKDIEAILISDIIKNKLEEDYIDFNTNTRILETISIKQQIEDITKKVSIKNTPFNILISGIDAYGDINQTSRNDVNIIATINPNTNEILLTSIPRDYYVQLHDKTGYKDKLTHASYYGINTVVQTIEDIFDTDINYYVKVNFTTVVELVDELGGIDIYADQAVNLYPCSIKKGYNNVNGDCALGFARERHSYIDGDRHRGRNQQEVIKAIFTKITSGSTLISEYTNILNVLDGKFATNIDMDEVLKLLKYELNDLKTYHIESTQVDGDGAMLETYSYPYQKLWVMIPNEDTVNNAKELMNKVLNNEKIKHKEEQ